MNGWHSILIINLLGFWLNTFNNLFGDFTLKSIVSYIVVAIIINVIYFKGAEKGK